MVDVSYRQDISDELFHKAVDMAEQHLKVIEQLNTALIDSKHKIELLEAELSAYRLVFGDTYQRNNSRPAVSVIDGAPEWKPWPAAHRT